MPVVVPLSVATLEEMKQAIAGPKNVNAPAGYGIINMGLKMLSNRALRSLTSIMNGRWTWATSLHRGRRQL